MRIQKVFGIVAVLGVLVGAGFVVLPVEVTPVAADEIAGQAAPVLLSGWQNISDRYVLILESTSTGALGVATSRDSQDDADLEWLFLTPRGTDIRVTRPEMSRMRIPPESCHPFRSKSTTHSG